MLHPDIGSEKLEIEFLREVKIFSELRANEEALKRFLAMMAHRSYKPGEVILREGEAGNEAFVLLEGEASVFKSTPEGDEYRVAVLHSAKHVTFGEGGLLESEARSATIKADSLCRCLVLGREEFTAIGKTHPQWAYPVLLRIAQAVMHRLIKTNNDLMLLHNALIAEIRGQ